MLEKILKNNKLINNTHIEVILLNKKSPYIYENKYPYI